MVEVSNLKTAEMVKLLENIYRSVNIGLVNEIKKITDKMGMMFSRLLMQQLQNLSALKPFYLGSASGGALYDLLILFIYLGRLKSMTFTTTLY